MRVSRALAELLIIVTGVLVALWVEDWREGRADRALEQEYVERLIEDVAGDSAFFDELQRHVDRTNQAADLLLGVVRGARTDVSEPAKFVAALEESRSIQNSPWATGTYDELLATGNMRVLRNRDLKSSLNLYFLSLEGLYTWVERRVDRTYRDRTAALLPNDVREGVYARHFWSWDSTRAVPSDAWLDSVAATVDVPAALMELRAVPEVEVLLARVADVSSGQLEYLERTANQNHDLLALLRIEVPR